MTTRIRISFIAAVAAAGLSAGNAMALDCAVPADVMARTTQLGATVGAQIEISKAKLLAEELLQRERLLGAMKVVTRQESATGEQQAQVIAKSTEAAASVDTAQRLAYSAVDAKERYGVTGFRACDLKTTATSFYQATVAQPARAAALRSGTYWKPGQWGSPKDWAGLATGSGTYDASSVLNGDTAGAQNYINFLVGPPVEQAKNSATAAHVQLLEKHGNDARKSVVATVLADIAAENAPDGPRAKLAAMVKHWVGDDGGTQWATETADKNQRAALLDAVRIEAANIASLAWVIKDQARTELAFASLALARINAKVSNPGPVATSAGGPDRRAGLQ